jgi:hypothetical protein
VPSPIHDREQRQLSLVVVGGKKEVETAVVLLGVDMELVVLQSPPSKPQSATLHTLSHMPSPSQDASQTQPLVMP